MSPNDLKGAVVGALILTFFMTKVACALTRDLSRSDAFLLGAPFNVRDDGDGCDVRSRAECAKPASQQENQQ